MTRIRFVAMTLIMLGAATGAFAQSLDDIYAAARTTRTAVRFDPLDPVSRAAILAGRGMRGGVSAPTTTPSPVVFATPEAPASVAAPVRTIVDQRPSSPSRFMDALNGISAGLQVSHEALGVYEHAIKANALKNYYDAR